jgi:hypothetical protein
MLNITHADTSLIIIAIEMGDTLQGFMRKDYARQVSAPGLPAIDWPHPGRNTREASEDISIVR